jgi:hypothetical protein
MVGIGTISYYYHHLTTFVIIIFYLSIMFGGLALPDLFVGLVVGNTALFVILLAIINAIAHTALFIVIPALQLVYGALLLLDTAHTAYWLAYVPLFHHLAQDDRLSVIVVGYLLMSAAWSNYFIGYATKPLVKIAHGVLVSFSSFLLWRAYAEGKLPPFYRLTLTVQPKRELVIF